MIGPEATPLGTVKPADVMVPLVTLARCRAFTVTRSLALEAAKFVPVRVTGLPYVAIFGVMAVIVGLLDAVTVNCFELVADPSGTETETGPVVAPPGTVAMIWYGVAEIMEAAVPLNETVSWDAVAPKFIPEIVT